ncbi:MAG TPA: Nif3-like dinuclear metal center hexameric protein [Gemmatimonadales bacterium]|nr:Nif3-like dinuclear metal center hexameric protein [Gemmatimonadales bacterium]
MATALGEIVAHLDRYLSIAEVPDHENAVNGLQVENSGMVARLVAAVDASQATIEGAVQAGPGPVLLLVHHGLFWDGSRALTGRAYRRVRTLLQHDAALYSAHIPLDIHPEVGNNPVLARELGLEDTSWFGELRGVPLGVLGQVPPRLRNRGALVAEVERLLRLDPGAARLIPGGPATVQRVGVITGAAGNMIAAARAAGVDTFVTGEGSHPSYFDAMEWGLNVIYAGHYATETVGVQALARHLSERFGLPWEFHDHPTGM